MYKDIKDKTCMTKTDMPVSKIGEEIGMLDVDLGVYYMANKVASYIWEAMAEPIKICDLVDALMVKYEVTREQCQEDVALLITTMMDKNLLVMTGE